MSPCHTAGCRVTKLYWRDPVRRCCRLFQTQMIWRWVCCRRLYLNGNESNKLKAGIFGELISCWIVLLKDKICRFFRCYLLKEKYAVEKKKFSFCRGCFYWRMKYAVIAVVISDTPSGRWTVGRAPLSSLGRTAAAQCLHPSSQLSARDIITAINGTRLCQSL